MNLYRIGVLLRKEARQGATNFLFIYAIVTPVLLSLLVALVFGDLFAQTPRIGLHDAGASRLTAALEEMTHIQTTRFDSAESLRAAVERGAVEVGIILADDFDTTLQAGTATDFVLYSWGQASSRNLVIIESAVLRAFTAAADVDLTTRVNINQLGDADDTTWSQRLLPLIIIMAVMLGGLMIPASSLIDERQRRTLYALTSTPATLVDVYLSKTVMGIVVSTLMGIVILVLNSAFGSRPGLLLGIVALGAVMASAIGIIIGTFVKDMDGMMAVLKVFGIVMFGPGFFAMIPQIPQWVSRLFPTWYVINPLLDISQRGATLRDVAGDVAVLAAIVGVLVLAVVRVVERQQKTLAYAA